MTGGADDPAAPETLEAAADPEPPAPRAAQPKADPASFALRGRPGRVVRFRRGAILGLAAAGSTALIGVAWIALKPATFHILADEDRQEDAGRKSQDALAGAPKSYADVPKLGPPLPGDLGRPILRRQEAFEAQGVPGRPDGAAQLAEQARQRAASERKSARESAVMLSLGGADRAAGTAAGGEASASSQGTTAAVEASSDAVDARRKRSPAANAQEAADINPHSLVAPPSRFTLSAGSIIAASLITGLNSDLPGLVTAQVTQNSYDSATGRILLIPQGARLIGSYDTVVAFGQKRALVVWQRIILPGGASIRLDNMPATDAAGYAGLRDKVDVHGWELLKGVALSTLLGIGTEIGMGNTDSDLVRAIQRSTQQSGSRAGDQLVSRNIDIQPTITVRPGWPLRIVVNKDLVFGPCC